MFTPQPKLIGTLSQTEIVLNINYKQENLLVTFMCAKRDVTNPRVFIQVREGRRHNQIPAPHCLPRACDPLIKNQRLAQ